MIASPGNWHKLDLYARANMRNAQKVIWVNTLSIFGKHHCPSPYSLHSPTRSLKQDNEAYEGG